MNKNAKTFLPVALALLTLIIVAYLATQYNNEEHRYNRLQDNLDRLVLAMSESSDSEADIAYEIQETINTLEAGDWRKYNVEYYIEGVEYAQLGRFDDAVYAIQTGTALNARKGD